jgi:hypothetical protein
MIYCFEQISFKPIGHPLEDDNKEKNTYFINVTYFREKVNQDNNFKDFLVSSKVNKNEVE